MLAAVVLGIQVRNSSLKLTCRQYGICSSTAWRWMWEAGFGRPWVPFQQFALDRDSSKVA